MTMTPISYIAARATKLQKADMKSKLVPEQIWSTTTACEAAFEKRNALKKRKRRNCTQITP